MYEHEEVKMCYFVLKKNLFNYSHFLSIYCLGEILFMQDLILKVFGIKSLTFIYQKGNYYYFFILLLSFLNCRKMFTQVMNVLCIFSCLEYIYKIMSIFKNQYLYKSNIIV